MYVTSANECYALDAGSGPRDLALPASAHQGARRQRRRRHQPRRRRVAGDRVFMVTDHAHLIALNRFTGALLWETEMADWRQNYNATGAPLVVGQPRRHRHVGRRRRRARIRRRLRSGDRQGSLALLDRAAARRAGSETWQGKGIEHPGATTWMTGTYDPELDTVYWPTGNPSPDLYRRRSRRRQPLLRFDRGARREDRQAEVALPIHAARRLGLGRAGDAGARSTRPGRASRASCWCRPTATASSTCSIARTASSCSGKQFAKNVTWASGLTPKAGRSRCPNMEPTLEGKRVCPSLDGASNWYSTSFNPATGPVLRADQRQVRHLHEDADGVAGRQGLHGRLVRAGARRAGAARPARDRHSDRQASSGNCRRAARSTRGAARSSTAGGLVIFGEDSGSLMAADATNGKPLWSFQTNQLWKASPMTYMFDNKQYVAVAAGLEHHRVWIAGRQVGLARSRPHGTCRALRSGAPAPHSRPTKSRR